MFRAPDTRVMPLTRRHVTELLTRHINDGIVIQNTEGHILWANAAFSTMTGYELSELLGHRPQEILLPEDMRPTSEELAEFRYDTESGMFEDFEIVQNQRKSGELYWVQLSFRFVDTEDGRRVVVTARDISNLMEATDELSRAKVELEHAVHFDALTSLANRRRLTSFLDKAFQQARTTSGTVALFHIDLDKFKDINDTHGHAAGDAILVHAAEAMLSSIRDEDLVARLGGDEFVIVMPNAPKQAEISRFADRILKRVTAPFLWQGLQLNCGASIGIALSDNSVESSESLMQNADFALYDVKRRGRGAIAFYDGRLRAAHHAQKQTADALREAIEADDLTYFFQPLICAQTFRLVGMETLARWNRPGHGLEPPDRFLSVAQDIGMLRDIDLAAMRAGISALAKLREEGLPKLRVSFNASSHTLIEGGLAEQIAFVADAHEVAHSWVGVEVLETVFFGQNASETQVAKEMEALVQAGFPTLLDDFGVGFAGLAHLAELTVTGIKIDRSLVARMTIDPNSAAIVRSILHLCQELSLHSVAEGIEDAKTAHMLRDSGCVSLQGYGIGRPMTLEAFTRWARAYDPDTQFALTERSVS